MSKTASRVSRKKYATWEQKIAFLRAHPEILRQPFPNPLAQSEAVFDALLSAGLISPKTGRVDVRTQEMIAELRKA